MSRSNSSIIILLFGMSLCLFSCKQSSKVEVKDTSQMHKATPEEIESLVEQFILAEAGTTINIPAGFYEMSTQLIIDNLENVKILGAGMEQTILSFKTLKVGAEGMKIVGKNILMQDFAVYDAPGDGIKTHNCDGITFRRINATWTNGDKSKNGTYALYPVQSKNVLIDECTASHSRDAGIYVGQSENIVVKNCTAFGNVAGIEIENCTNAEVFNCKAYDNSAGILVFNLPDLPIADGKRTRVYNNEIIENNHINFATPISETPNGNTITMVPPGSGVILMAAKQVEVFNNKILKNKTVGVIVSNYHITGFPMDAPNWSPYSSDISIHDNEYERPAALPDMTKDFGKLLAAKNAHGVGKSQDIVYDGFWDESTGKDIAENPMNICIREKNMNEMHFTRFDLRGGEKDIKAYKDYTPFECDYSVETDVQTLTQL